MVDTLTNQLSNISLLVKKSAEKGGNIRKVGDKECYFCGEEGHYARSCSRNPHRNTICGCCGRRGHHESTCYSKKTKEELTNVVQEDEETPLDQVGRKC